MPVQINEIVIRANVIEPASQLGHIKPTAQSSADKEAIIKECTQIILEILKAQTER